MTLRAPEPTAEQVTQATEAAFLLGAVATQERIARFMSLDLTVPYQRQQVDHALAAAQMLQLVVETRRRTSYEFSVLVPCMVKAPHESKRVFFRVHLDRFEPYTLFSERLRTGEAPLQAATQVCALCDVAEDAHVLRRAFENWGTYAGSLVREDGGHYVPVSDSEMTPSLLKTLESDFHRTQHVREFLLQELGDEAYRFIEGNVRDTLADAVGTYINENDPRSVVMYLGNAFEDFLRLVAHRKVKLSKETGISTMADSLRSRNLIAKKHLGSIRQIAVIRNAADHGGDHDENDRPWQVVRSTARLMMLSILASVRSISRYRQSGTLEL